MLSLFIYVKHNYLTCYCCCFYCCCYFSSRYFFCLPLNPCRISTFS